jgi:3-dehydroquinate synthetase
VEETQTEEDKARHRGLEGHGEDARDETVHEDDIQFPASPQDKKTKEEKINMKVLKTIGKITAAEETKIMSHKPFDFMLKKRLKGFRSE